MTLLLSICIPTYNRADLLRSAICSLAGQINELGDEVQLIVSDNCSTDNTQSVIESIGLTSNIRYHRNDSNVGAIRNTLNLIENLAKGEFCWLIGDDDMIRDGGVRKLLQAIKDHSDLDYFYVNYSIDSFERRDGFFVTAEDFKDWTRTGNPNLEERRVDRWETLIAEDFNGMTPIYCSVFRRSAWLQAADSLRVKHSYTGAVLYSSVAETYPQSLIFARMMIGKPTWSSGYPWVIMCGKESWSEFIPTIVLLRFHELLDVYLDFGTDERLVEGHRRRMLGYAVGPLTRFLQGETPPGLETFSLPAFILRHHRYKELWRAVRDAVTVASIRQIARRSLLVGVLAIPAKAFFRCLRRIKGPRDRTVVTAAMRGEGSEHS